MGRIWGGRRPSSVAAAIALVGLTTFLGAGPTWADTPDAAGFWGPLPVIPLPPPVGPDGGLWVAALGQDLVAYSAIRSSGQAPILSLKFADHLGEPFTLVACPVVTPWEPPGPEGGDVEDGPGFDCERFVTGIETDGRLVFDLAPLLGGDGFDVALVPSPASEAIFSVTFTALDSASITGESAPPTPDTSTPTSAPPGSVSPLPTAAIPFVPPPLGDMTVDVDPPVEDAAPVAGAAPRVPGSDPPVVGRGRTEPLALLLGIAVLSTWGYRHRSIRSRASAHVLSQGPLSAAAALRGGAQP